MKQAEQRRYHTCSEISKRCISQIKSDDVKIVRKSIDGRPMLLSWPCPAGKISTLLFRGKEQRFLSFASTAEGFVLVHSLSLLVKRDGLYLLVAHKLVIVIIRAAS